MKTLYRFGLAAALVAIQFPLAAVDAYVDIELDNGRHVVGETYKDEGAKLVVYRPIGKVEVDRTSVRSVRELLGAMPSDAQKTIAPASAPESSTSAVSSVQRAGPSSSAPDARAREITSKLFEVYRFRLAAKNRGDEESFAKFDKEATRLVQERAELLDKAKSEKPKTD